MRHGKGFQIRGFQDEGVAEVVGRNFFFSGLFVRTD
jgi:hypothetical protein